MADELTQFIAAAQQKIEKVTKQETSFKKGIDSLCRLPGVIKSGKTKECAASLMQSNPIKAINSGEQTVYFLKKLYKCLQYASDQVERVGENGLQNIRSLTPTDLLYLLPKTVSLKYVFHIGCSIFNNTVILITQYEQYMNINK